MDEQEQAQITQLQQQQMMLTQALKAALEGRWVGGADTVEGWLLAIDPGLTGELSPDPPSYP